MQALAWAGLAATTFAAALLQAASGFGFALVAVPLFLLLLDPAGAIQLVVILTVALSAAVLPALRRAVDPGLLLRLALGSLVGLPLGGLAFRLADPAAMRAAVGAVILAFAALLALLPRRRGGALFATNRFLDCAAGAVSGITTALFGISGPPLMIYLLLGGVSAARLRASLLSFFFLCYAATIVLYAAGPGIPLSTWIRAGVLIPFAFCGGSLGKRLGDRLGARAFTVLAIALLALTGGYTLVAALTSAPPQNAGHSAAHP
ncbi:MAG TPA: sulfite exporter TauE/SafE family protein [Stellaceae bacterium]|nr:sulfite exporter TauE/SafE family protein [Stellaceae bacterium]